MKKGMRQYWEIKAVEYGIKKKCAQKNCEILFL